MSREDELKERLIKNNMAPDLVDRAVDCWITLLRQPQMSEILAACPHVNGTPTTEYAFFQGFVAGYMASTHHN